MIEARDLASVGDALLVLVEISGPVTGAPEGPALIVRPDGGPSDDPTSPKALHAGQRACRELLRALADGWRSGRRPRVHVWLNAPSAIALDLGRRLAGYEVTWQGDRGGAVPTLPEGEDLAILPPEDPVLAAHLGRALAARALRSCQALVDRPEGRVVGLELVAATLPYGSAATPTRLAHDEARFARQQGRPADALAALQRVTELEGDTADLALKRADLRRQSGDREGALADLALAARLAPTDAYTLRRCAHLLIEAEAPAEGLVQAEAALAIDPTLAPAHLAALEARLKLGRVAEGIAAASEAVVRLSDPTDLRVRLAEAHLGPRDDERLLHHALAGLAGAPAHPLLLDLRAEAGARLRHADAVMWIQAALEADPSRWEPAVARLVAAGHPGEAEALLAHASGPQAASCRARFALWRLHLDEAASQADLALATLPEDAQALLVRGAVACCRGQPAEALLVLDQALQVFGRRPASPLLDDDAILTWRSEARRLLGDRVRARAEASAAMTAARTYSVVAHLQRVLAATLPDPAQRVDESVDAYLWAPVAAKVGHLCPDASRLTGGTRAEVHHQMLGALAHFGGNRSCWPTLLQGDRLVPFPTPPHPRAEGRRLQMRLKTRSPAEVLAAFEALRATFPSEPITRTYTGETLLWLGRYPEAEAMLREALALDPLTVWAWIGLGAALMLQGRHEEALVTWDEGVRAVAFEGPTLFVYRGECRRLRGELDLAVRDLDVALADKSFRLSAWVLRALLAADLGDPAPAAVVCDALAGRNAGAMEDARAMAGSDDPVAVLTALHAAMKGNRSASQASYLTEAGALRFLTWPRKLRPGEVFGTRR